MGTERTTDILPEQNLSTADTPFVTSRKSAQTIDFAKLNKTAKELERLILRNPTRSDTKSFIQYTKDRIKTYIQSPSANIDNIREVSKFLSRVSMLYKKILAYNAVIPLWNYNITMEMDFTKPLDRAKALKKYNKCLKFMHQLDMKKTFPSVVATAMRDGLYVGFVYQFDNGKLFLHALDPKYCKIIGKNSEDQWVVYFNAAFFAAGNNKQFVDDSSQDTSTLWDPVFIEGYKAYDADRQNNQWFELPAERVLCLPAGWDDEFDLPLPYYTPLFTSLLDLLDLEQILMSRTELQNYVLLLSKIPLFTNTEEMDDYAVSLDSVQKFQSLIDAAVPDLVGTAYAPFDLEAVTFEQSNSSEETDKLQQAMNNLFSNAGISELVVAGGSSTNSVGLKHSIQNDEANAFIYMDRIQSWLQFFMQENGYLDFIFKFHRQSYFSRDEYIQGCKDFATLGGSAMDYYTARDMTPYEAYNKILTEQMLDVKSMMMPLQSSYTQSKSSSTGGAPKKDEDDLTEEGIDTREANKNEGTRASE